jgi:YidC/Oxa1 family membrane protein insertase
MDQRLFLAIALSMLVLIGYYLIFPPPSTQRPKQPPPAAESSGPGAPAAPGSVAGQGGQSAALAGSAPGLTAAAPAPAAGAAPAAQAEGKVVRVETPLYVATVDTRGGTFTSFKLKRYKVEKDNINWGDLLPFLRRLPYLKHWLTKPNFDPDANEDMAPLPQMGVADLGMRFIGEDSLTRATAGLVYQADADALRIADAKQPAQTLVLRGSGADGLIIEKRLTFHPDSYIVDYAVSVANYGERPKPLRMAMLFGEGPQGAHDPKHYRSHRGPIWHEDGDLETESPDDVAPTRVVQKPEWLGMTDTYFITAAQAKTPISHGFYEGQEVQHDTGKIWIAAYGMELPQVELEPAKMVTSEFKLYLGPKRVSEMVKFGSKLDASLDLTLDVLAQPMLALMRWFHTFTGNYGVSIIMLTIVVRVLLFPLTYRGMLSIKRMQKLQPRMTALREKFKKDKERLNREMMTMYRKHKMNPLGGCLPIALQIPIFFALYSALLGAIELRHEPFIWWITDLSAMDGLYITPLLMGVSMLVQQRMTPTAMDPTQAKIMMWMPVVFTFFMVNFPSGLVVYWLTSNVLSVAQQVIINRIKVPEPQD